MSSDRDDLADLMRSARPRVGGDEGAGLRVLERHPFDPALGRLDPVISMETTRGD